MLRKIVIRLFLRLIRAREIEKKLKAIGYSNSSAKELANSFRKAVRMCLDD